MEEPDKGRKSVINPMSGDSLMVDKLRNFFIPLSTNLQFCSFERPESSLSTSHKLQFILILPPQGFKDTCEQSLNW